MSGAPPRPEPSERERQLRELASRYDDAPEDRERVVSVFGGASRSGPWLPAEETRAVAGFGNVTLDFTRAELPAGETRVDAWALFGNVEIRVPADLEVELSGIALMGSLVHREGGDTRERLRRWLRGPARDAAARDGRRDVEAVLCIRGTAIFGNVVVQVV